MKVLDFYVLMLKQRVNWLIYLESKINILKLNFNTLKYI